MTFTEAITICKTDPSLRIRRKGWPFDTTDPNYHPLISVEDDGFILAEFINYGKFAPCLTVEDVLQDDWYFTKEIKSLTK